MRAAAREILTYLCETIDITTRHLTEDDVEALAAKLKTYLDEKVKKNEANRR